jgi:hypoxanthine phosphoribosyltransferase
VSWETYYDLIKAAHGHLMHDAGDRHAYKPTLLIGISRGGIIVADLLSRIGNLPMAILYADRTSHDVRYDRVALQHVVEAHVKSQAERRARLLLVDDVMKSGRSLINARALLDELAAALANGGAPVEVQSLVLFKRAGHTKDIIEPEHVMSDYSRKMEILLPYGLG